ncbi:tetratricopeptide repeat protein [Leptolyngbya ectocarpi]|uniref:tetratricopeptide repeat protein n=1 Tax=Leptolyngbya ectocarpi TaxID=1202 RepID=UPI001D14E3E0|nr:tetratricopeptide repeat protein [Leptolyngbya ectocarpi]
MANLGGTLTKLKRFSKATEVLHQALILIQAIEARPVEATIYRYFAFLYQETGEEALAAEYRRKAAELASELSGKERTENGG